MGGKINLSVALCEDSGSGLGGGGALPSREKRREGLNESRYTNKVSTESERNGFTSLCA